jgi:hypothetical protein
MIIYYLRCLRGLKTGEAFLITGEAVVSGLSLL